MANTWSPFEIKGTEVSTLGQCLYTQVLGEYMSTKLMNTLEVQVYNNQFISLDVIRRLDLCTFFVYPLLRWTKTYWKQNMGEAGPVQCQRWWRGGITPQSLQSARGHLVVARLCTPQQHVLLQQQLSSTIPVYHSGSLRCDKRAWFTGCQSFQPWRSLSSTDTGPNYWNTTSVNHMEYRRFVECLI